VCCLEQDKRIALSLSSMDVVRCDLRINSTYT
jgi:hypothetical protein